MAGSRLGPGPIHVETRKEKDEVEGVVRRLFSDEWLLKFKPGKHLIYKEPIALPRSDIMKEGNYSAVQA